MKFFCIKCDRFGHGAKPASDSMIPYIKKGVQLWTKYWIIHHKSLSTSVSLLRMFLWPKKCFFFGGGGTKKHWHDVLHSSLYNHFLIKITFIHVVFLSKKWLWRHILSPLHILSSATIFLPVLSAHIVALKLILSAVTIYADIETFFYKIEWQNIYFKLWHKLSPSTEYAVNIETKCHWELYWFWK